MPLLSWRCPMKDVCPSQTHFFGKGIPLFYSTGQKWTDKYRAQPKANVVLLIAVNKVSISQYRCTTDKSVAYIPNIGGLGKDDLSLDCLVHITVSQLQGMGTRTFTHSHTQPEAKKTTQRPSMSMFGFQHHYYYYYCYEST